MCYIWYVPVTTGCSGSGTAHDVIDDYTVVLPMECQLFRRQIAVSFWLLCYIPTLYTYKDGANMSTLKNDQNKCKRPLEWFNNDYLPCKLCLWVKIYDD